MGLPNNWNAQLTDVGRVRSENQDSCQEFRDPSGTQLLVVADGMGGHQGGATASRLAIEAIGQVFARSPHAGPDMLREALETANERVYRTAAEHPELHGMGTTCVALWFGVDGSAWVAHVGDSRGYQARNGKLHPITADHSAVAELQRRGMITAEEAAVHPRRNELLRSIGVEPSVEVDVSPVDLQPGDRFLLCSDGLSGVVEDDEIGAVLARETPEQAVRELVDTANARGGPDNITVVVSFFADANGRHETAAPAGAGHRSDTDPDRERRNTVRTVALAAGVVAVLLVAAIVMLVASGTEP